jgi:serpin B
MVRATPTTCAHPARPRSARVPDRLEPVTLDLMLPKFEFRARTSLGEALSAMGMPTAFSRQADFAGMTRDRPLVIDRVVQEAVIGVDEEGAEAAAAMAVGLRFLSADSQSPQALIVDRPFLFFIRDKATGAILFLGQVLEPTE